MLRISLSLAGKKGQRSFRIRVRDSRFKRDTNKFIEDLGYWNARENKIKIDKEKYEKWIKCGAQPTKTIEKKIKENY